MPWVYFEELPTGGGGGGGGGNDNWKGCLGCLGSLVVIGVIAWLAKQLGGLHSALQLIILLVAAGFAIRALVYMIGDIRDGLSMNFLEFTDFLPLILGVGAGLITFFLLTHHNLKAAFFLGALAANIPLSND